MKRILSLSILLALSLMTFAQEITVRFTGQLNGTAYQQLDSVVVTNTTRGWTETIVYPDTLIVLGSMVNISENEALVVGLGQNVPNPFDCQTRVELTISQNENVRMQLMDVSGKVYAEFNDNLEAGTHNFEISAAKAQTYILNAVAGNRNYSIRMVNVGSGCNNGIRYQGYKGVLETKLVSTKEFQVGDHLQCEGYATHNGERLESSASFILEGNYTRVFDFHYCATTYGVDEHTACDIFMWIDGITYTSSNNTATYTLQNAAGCDSIVTLNLTINHSNTGVDTQTACDSYTWIDGITYTSSNNTATYTLQNAAGCDSIVTLNLTINHSNTGVDTQTACDSYTWIDGNTYIESNNTATYTLQNAAGCDSIVTLNLTINHSNTGVDVQTACDSYTWIDGITYTSSNNTATYTLQNAAGCDSIVTLNLTINHSNTGVDVQTACDSYTWIDGITYTSSNNTATVTLQNAVGCDSIVTLNLTINSNTGVDTQTASESYTWIDGITYTESTDTPTYTFTNAAGCDSVVTLHLTICHCGDADYRITDYDGNQYGTVLIGEQCWMAENLKTTHFADGTSISLGSSTSTTTAYRYNPHNDSNNVSIYGYLYNWPAAMHGANSSDTNPSNVQGICPNGWHLPSDAEWTQLTDYVSSQSEYQCDGTAENIAKALASTTGWSSNTTTCAVGNTPSSNNSTGFGALPAGVYVGSYGNFGYDAYFWSATENGSSDAYFRDLYYGDAYVNRGYYNKYYGRSVRCVRDEDAQETSLLPTVTTTNVSSITVTSAVCGGDVISAGGATVTARGVCWSTSQDPTINNSITTDGTGTGSFTSNLTGLTANTTYYVRAYATNSVGTAYGEQKTFTTNACNCGAGVTVTDYDGNQYGTVLISEQCWMAQNLKTTHFADGTSITLGSSTSTTTAYRYNPNNDSNNVSIYGYLYNWPAAMHGANSSDTNPSNVQGICPNGWHLPSDAEWTQLIDYVSSQSEYQCDGTAVNIAKALASTTGWNSYSTICAVGNTPSSNNSTGFGALPAGINYGSCYDFGDYAYFWSATEGGSSYAYDRVLGYKYANVGRSYDGKDYGNSVRCVRDEDAQETSLLPTVTTTNVSSITVTSAVCGGDVISDGGATVTARGVCWSTSQDPTINNNITTDGTGTGSFTSNLTGLTANTTYYVRAYATNSVGTAYGEQKTFTTSACNCGAGVTVTDYDGNEYGTVLIGEQCWMAQNLKTTHFADGTSISLGSSTSSTTAYRYNPNNDSNNVSIYGYLYNWPAAMHGANSSSTNPSNVQGICPNGWHLPSDAEWTQLTDYVSSQSEYQCDGTAENIAKALASTTGWSSYPTTCAVGNTPSSNNSTGFGALPAGYYGGSYNDFGDGAYFWSATENSSSGAYGRSLYYYSAGVARYGYDKYDGRSVRCVRD